MQGKSLAIGDGANDVSMIQSADVGVGIAGKEGRQAANNSDYIISQFRFLVRLLLVHGHTSHFRLGRLIKYFFYKNATFAALLFYFQFFNGFSGQAIIDGISASTYNVLFTSIPCFFFALLDRPTRHFSTLTRYPRTYNLGRGLTTGIFWKTSILLVRPLPPPAYRIRHTRTQDVPCRTRNSQPSFVAQTSGAGCVAPGLHCSGKPG